MGTKIKVYLVQLVGEDGVLSPEIVACKLTHLAAHLIAKQLAPAKVTGLVADKTAEINGEPDSSRGGSNQNGSRWNFPD
jgi:hypothetical protein